MVTTLYLVRHGATEDSRGDGEARYKGSTDVPLSELGKEQVAATARALQERLAALAAARAADYLSQVHGGPTRQVAGGGDRLAAADRQGGEAGSPPPAAPAAVYCSPLSRAVVSARIVAAPFGLEPIPLADLRERHFGVWEGMSFAEIRAAWPDHFTAWAADPLGFSPPEGENTLAVARRGRAAIKKILAAHPGREVVVVAHGGINRVILCHFLQLPLRHIFRIEQSLACLNVVELWEKYPVVKLLNG